jgi:hypothetical protein
VWICASYVFIANPHHHSPNFRRVYEIAKSDYWLRHVCLSAHPSVRPHAKLGSHGTNFHEISYTITFRKSVQKIQVLLKSDKNNSYFKQRPNNILDHISLTFCWKDKYFRQICTENQDPHFMFNYPFFFF